MLLNYNIQTFKKLLLKSKILRQNLRNSYLKLRTLGKTYELTIT